MKDSRYTFSADKGGGGNPLLGIVGPTASGKTAVGIALARLLDGEIISADAVAVYRGLDIGSAKPDATERAHSAFHIIDVAEPDEDFTLADFQRLAEAAITEIRGRGKTPILVGGTGLYVRSVTATLSMPHVPPQPEIRARLWEEAEHSGAAQLHDRLKEVDSPSASKIQAGDAKRIIRALEVWEATGQPMSSFHTPEGVQGTPRPNTILFGLNMTRPTLYARIEKRVEAMMAAGFEEEVRGLLAAGYPPELKSLQSLGYRHLCASITGKISREQAVTELKRDTRRYAKRQFSWFNADTNIVWKDADVLAASGTGGANALAHTIAESLVVPQREAPSLGAT